MNFDFVWFYYFVFIYIAVGAYLSIYLIRKRASNLSDKTKYTLFSALLLLIIDVFLLLIIGNPYESSSFAFNAAKYTGMMYVVTVSILELLIFLSLFLYMKSKRNFKI